jgi:hypothetical protein
MEGSICRLPEAVGSGGALTNGGQRSGACRSLVWRGLTPAARSSKRKKKNGFLTIWFRVRPVHMGVRPLRKNRAPNFSRALFISFLYYHTTYQLGKIHQLTFIFKSLVSLILLWSPLRDFSSDRSCQVGHRRSTYVLTFPSGWSVCLSHAHPSEWQVRVSLKPSRQQEQQKADQAS